MYLFQDLKKQAKQVDFKSAEDARKWYRNAAMNIAKNTEVDRDKIMKTAGAFKIFPDISSPAVGKLYMFFYDAKYKDTMPFFDMFPLVFPIQFYADGFLGLNLHYLPPMARAGLMDSLYTIANNHNYNKSMKLTVSYSLLKQAAIKFSRFQECLKKYLFGQVRSSYHYVNPADWDKALMLPMQKWHINPLSKYSSKSAPPY